MPTWPTDSLHCEEGRPVRAIQRPRTGSPSCPSLKAVLEAMFTEWREWHAHFHIIQHPQERFTGAQHELQHQHLAYPSLWILPCRIIYPCMVLLLTVAHQANQLNSEIPSHLPPLYTINNHGVVETFPRSQGLSTERSMRIQFKYTY
jgi:hypothetical protein